MRNGADIPDGVVMVDTRLLAKLAAESSPHLVTVEWGEPKGTYDGRLVYVPLVTRHGSWRAVPEPDGERLTL